MFFVFNSLFHSKLIPRHAHIAAQHGTINSQRYCIFANFATLLLAKKTSAPSKIHPKYSPGTISHNLTLPQLLEEIHNIDTLNITHITVKHIKRDYDTPTAGELITKRLQPFQMTALYFLCRFYFNGHTGITKHCIHFKTSICAPVSQLLSTMGITKIRNDFLYNQMFKSMSVVNGTTHEIRTIEKVIHNTHIKEIESWGFGYTTLISACVCRYAISYKSIFKNIKIFGNSGGRYPTVLSDVVVIHHLAIGLRCYFKETLKRPKVSHKRFFLDLFF